MNIALIGASGYVGAALLDELLARGHHVSALVGHPEKLAARPGLRARKVDALDAAALAAALTGHDAVISAFSGHAQHDVRGYYVAGMRAIITAAKQTAAPRLLVVGGAGSLYVAPGVQLVDTAEFPAQWKGTAEGARDALALLQAETALEWTMLSPAAELVPGERSGHFRLGGDALLSDAAGRSWISLQDYAVALVDELETPAHRRQRFSVAY
jgi:putative NADH-flavin reductase